MACGPGVGDDEPEPPPEPPPEFVRVVDSPRAALLSVGGTAADDVWMVGADDGEAAVVLRWDGAAWTRHDPGVRGDLWWVHALPDGPAFFGGSEAHLLRYADGSFERIPTPGLGRHTVFGVFAVAADDVYAVGAEAGRNGFVWHYDGDTVRAVVLPPGLLPEDSEHDTPGLFKVWAHDTDDVWVVGARGVVLRGNARDGFSRIETAAEDTLFTVHGYGDQVAIVGGDNAGVVYEAGEDGALSDRTPEAAAMVQGACVESDGTLWVTGQAGEIYRGAPDGALEYFEHDVAFDRFDSLHAVWVDPDGGVWTVGGAVLDDALDRGQALYSREGVPEHVLSYTPLDAPKTCPEGAVELAPGRSMARRWNEQLLNAIRRAIPRPTVHARNLYHLSLAMWDTAAAYDDTRAGILVDEQHAADADARDVAIAHAAHRLLTHRYRSAAGGEVSLACFDAFMASLGLDPAMDGTTGDAPAAVGNRIGQAVIDAFQDDGANEENGYADPDGYVPDQPRLVVDQPGTRVNDPLLWQQIVLAEAVTQNGIPEGSGVRDYVGAHWGGVTPFALPAGASDQGGALDIGDPPTVLDERLVDAVVDVLRHGAELDFEDGVRIDISPGVFGNHSLGANDGTGHGDNPVTGEPYPSQMVRRGDFTRVMAEFWADGPTSETPPGHWNTLANQVADRDALSRELFGQAPALSPLWWDLHVYLALNGALHDAAIAAWGLKRSYVSARPITLIRYMGGLGQRSDPDGPAYDPDGLPLEPGLVEVITAETSAPGERHAQLARYVGEIAVWSWRGEPGDRDRDVGGMGWIRAKDWIPYQRRTFVTPAFPGYVSGHSTFSRAAAEVLTQLTGSPYFPGGLGSYDIEPGYLVFEYGPSEPLQLQWATYYDASDQAGRSRLWGGIHIVHDDFDGRRVGAEVGARAIERARVLFGLANP